MRRTGAQLAFEQKAVFEKEGAMIPQEAVELVTRTLFEKSQAAVIEKLIGAFSILTS